MQRQKKGKTLLTFQHVVACFSQEERELLYEWQEDLYANLMKEIQQVFMSLGPVIANSVFSFRAKEKDGVRPVGDKDSDRRPRPEHPPRQESDPSVTADDFSQGRESATSSSSEHEFTIKIISDGIKEEDEACPLADQKVKEAKCVHSAAESIPLTEPEVTIWNTVDGDGRGVRCTSIIAGLEKEAEACSEDQQDSEMKGSISILKEQEFSIKIISDCIKEEEEAYPVADQDPEEVKNTPTPATKQPETRSMNVKESDPCLQESHQQVHKTDRSFACTECEKRFNKKALLVEHQRIHAGLRPYLCTKCDKSFTGMSSLLRHERLHRALRPYHCSVCEKSFPRRPDLQNHLRTHTGERPYCCNECGKRFSQKSNLQTHQRIHTGERRFHCSVCEKSFVLKSDLQRHQRIHTGERPFHCTECEKTFTQKQNLLTHQRIHTGLRPFHCSVCEKRFANKSDLLKHLRSHTGEKPFACSVCEKRFTQRQNLLIHQKKHTGARPLK